MSDQERRGEEQQIRAKQFEGEGGEGVAPAEADEASVSRPAAAEDTGDTGDQTVEPPIITQGGG